MVSDRVPAEARHRWHAARGHVPGASVAAAMDEARRLLVANRGEIAVRIFSTCRRLGIGTVAVVGPGDANALHARVADDAVEVASYLDADALVAAAREADAQLVHPGYGFLAESAAFAEAVVDAGLTWIGPPPEALRRGGDKLEAKRIAAAAGVPTLPTGDPDDLGYPLLVKAAAGGGGRGMRVVERPEDLADALESAAREAEAAFGDGTVYCERYLASPRHVEVQLIGDRHGTVLALGERDCSVQRRHQKVIEESPPPGLPPALLERIAGHAVAFAAALGYESAGTAEFLVEGDEVFFLELNGRIQVEHPVTEAVTGLDIVELQLLVADGGSLADLRPTPTGHAVEARLYAEDPRTFLPQPGPVRRLVLPTDIRVDAGVEEGDEVGGELRPDDREADRPRRRPRRGTRQARESARGDGRRRGDDQPRVPPLARRAPGLPRGRRLDGLPDPFSAALPSPALPAGRTRGARAGVSTFPRRRRWHPSRSRRPREAAPRARAPTGASRRRCPAR